MNHRSDRKADKKGVLLSARFLSVLTGIYLFLLFVVFPLYYEQSYTNIGDAKWHFFRMTTVYAKSIYFPIPTFMFLFAVGLIWFVVEIQTSRGLADYLKEKSIVTDAFVLAYGVFTVIACFMTPYRQYLMDGYPTWYMGLWVQLGLIAIYFAVSYFWRRDNLGIMLFLLVSAVVICIALLNRFNIDPLGIYPDVPSIRRDYLSTIGQITMYSGYMMTIFPIGVYLYWSTDKKWLRIASFFYMVIGFMSAITANADSAFLGLAGLLIVLFWFSFRDNESMKRFLEVLLIMLLSWRIVGFLQIAFPDNAAKTSSLMIFASQSTVMWLPVFLVAILYVLLRLRIKKDGNFDVSSLVFCRNAVIAALPIFVVLMIVYIVLNTGNYLPEVISFGRNARKAENYLIFNDNWGNHRGITWITALKTIFYTAKDDIVRFIFGAGPDEYNEVVYHYCADELNAYFKNKQVICAHNETLTRFVNGGILGGIAYLGIFISAFVLSVKNSDKHPELIAVMMCIASYFFHNIFCYQRLTCTPFIFAIIAAGVNIIRNNKGFN